MEDRAIDMEVDGIRFISHGHYYDGINNWLCHKLKENDPQAITYCARQLVKMLPENAVVIPIPGHHGFALQTLYLARAINEQSDGMFLKAITGCRTIKPKKKVIRFLLMNWDSTKSVLCLMEECRIFWITA